MKKLVGTIVVVSAASLASPAQVVFEDNATTPGGIADTVDAFRAALGTLNANTPGSQPSGRREINWDGVPDSSSDPNLFPGNFFNGSTPGRARGIEFTTPGTGFLLSATAASGVPVAFGFPADFVPFSAQRMFTPLGSLITDVHFFVPGSSESAAVRGLGIVFNDVEDSSKLELFDAQGNSLWTQNVLTGPSGSLSFLGVSFNSALIASARITSGTAALLSNGIYGPGSDGVVMDDFIFGEPQSLAVPDGGSTALLALAGIAATLSLRNRQVS